MLIPSTRTTAPLLVVWVSGSPTRCSCCRTFSSGLPLGYSASSGITPGGCSLPCEELADGISRLADAREARESDRLD